MSCTRIGALTGASTLLHRALCRECRIGRRADGLIAFALACRRAEPVPAKALARTLQALELPHSLPRLRRDRFRRLIRTARRPAVCSAAGLAVLGYGYARYIEIEPRIAIPAHTLTGPNAFDDFMRAAALLKDDKLIREMLTPPPKPQSSLQAGRTAPPGTMGMPPLQGPVGAAPMQRTYAMEEKEAVLLENAPVFDLVSQGLARPYLAPPVRSFDAPVAYLGSFRSICRLLSLQANVEAARGDWSGAARSGLQSVELGIKVQTGSNVPGKMAGSTCQSMGREILWNTVDHLPAAQARDLAAQLETISALKPSTIDTLTEEKWSVMAGMLDLMSKPGWRSRGMSQDPGLMEKVAWYVMSLPYTKSRIVRLAENYIDAEITRASAPYTPPSLWNQEEPVSGPKLLEYFLPAGSAVRFRDGVEDTENGLLMTTLALRAFKLEQGTYPVHLGRLTDGYLHAVPRDPFTEKDSIRYRRTPSGYILYGVGPDGADNGGTPIVQPGSSSARYNVVDQTGSGDIVAGINRR